MAEIKGDYSNIGQIQIADEVIAVIAGTAASEVDGVVTNTGGFGPDFGKKNMSKGVKVTVNGNEVKIDLTISVKFGYKIQDVSSDVQKKVKTAIETMTGLFACEVNVNVASVQMEKTSKQKPE